jgi:hypothetical protein
MSSERNSHAEWKRRLQVSQNPYAWFYSAPDNPPGEEPDPTVDAISIDAPSHPETRDE